MEQWLDLVPAIISGKLGKKTITIARDMQSAWIEQRLLPIKWEPKAEPVVTIGAETTGRFKYQHVEDQIFTVEDLGHWYAIEFRGKAYLFPEKATKTKLVLTGVSGLEHANEWMKMICTLYEDDQLSTGSFPMTPTIWKCIPEYYRKDAIHWLAQRCDWLEGSIMASGICTAERGEITHASLLNGGTPSMRAFGVRPIIELKSGVKINLGSDPDKGYELKEKK